MNVSAGESQVALVRVTAAEFTRHQTGQLRAYSIDSLTSSTESDLDGVLLDGWAIGLDEPVVAIEVSFESKPGLRFAVSRERPDVVAAYPHLPKKCGFHGVVPVFDFDAAEFEFSIHASFESSPSVLLGTIRGKRLLLTADPSLRPRENSRYDETDFPLLGLDALEEGGALRPGRSVEGWALSPVGIKVISVWLDDVMVGRATHGLPREDIGRSFQDSPGAQQSGFRHRLVTLPEAASGTAKLTVVAEDWQGRRAAVSRSVALEPPGLSPPPASGSLDLPKTRPSEDVLNGAGWSGPLVVHGWAADPLGVDRVDVLVDGNVAVTAEFGLPREDVDMLNPDYRHHGLTENSGWLGIIHTDNFAPGKHTIGAILRGGSGELPLGESHVRFREDNVRADPRRQQRINELLRCPECGQKFRRSTVGALACVACHREIPTSEFGTFLFEETYAGLDWRLAVSTSHIYTPGAQEIIIECRDGLVLEVGAGLHENLPHVVQLDAIAYPTTDISADGQAMPFADESFDAVIACNLLEHVTSPASVVAEMRRVCKIGGRIYADSTTVHPYHGFPHHYFNATESGLLWLMEEVGGATGAAEPADARVAIRLVLQGWLGSIEDDATRAFAMGLPVSDLIHLLQHPDEDRERFNALNQLAPLGYRLVPPKVMFSGVRTR
jgi:SAM-dependent methyltransferase